MPPLMIRFKASPATAPVPTKEAVTLKLAASLAVKPVAIVAITVGAAGATGAAVSIVTALVVVEMVWLPAASWAVITTSVAPLSPAATV